MAVIIVVITALIAYLIGSVNSSIIMSKAFFGTDIRASGSGNAGATNMLRTHGTKMAVATLICDVLKGVIAVFIGIIIERLSVSINGKIAAIFLGNLKYIAGFFAVLGHNFPIFFQFKGGKGVSTCLGAMLVINPIVALIALIIAVILMATTKFVSLGSIVGAGIFPILLITFGFGKGELEPVGIFFAVLMAGLIIFRHRSNIKRLLNGTENKLSFSKEK